jgi:hypothetical protein
MTTAEKNIYEKKHDDVILEALKKSPTNRNEAFRMAEKELKSRYNMDANANQISSRFYTYIKPKYLDKKEEVKNHLSAGSGTLDLHDRQYLIIRDLAMKLNLDKRAELVNELFESLGTS